MPGVAQLRPDAAVGTGDIQSVLVGDLAPLIVVGAANDTTKLVGHVDGAAHAVLVGIILEDVVLDVLAPPVGALAGDLHAQLIQAVNVVGSTTLTLIYQVWR